jgi:hypothetical protein
MRVLAAALLLLLAPALASAQTAIRPDQICPGGVCATPDITWGPNAAGTGYAIGSTVPWRTDATTSPTIAATDAARTIELTNTGTFTVTVPPTTTTGMGDGFGFTIQTGGGTISLTSTSTINGQTTIRLGQWQLVSLTSRSNKWYATMSVPQPPTQSGNQLADNMTWTAAGTSGGGGAPTGSCAESTTFFARVWALPATLDGTVGASVGAGTGHLGAYDALICRLATDTVWSKLDALWMPASDDATHTPAIAQSIANLNLKAASGCTTACYTLVPTGSPTFVADRGYGATSYDASTTVWIDTGFNASTAGGQAVSGAAHMSVWALNNFQSVGFGKAMGGGNSALTQSTFVIPRASTGQMVCAVTQDASGTINTSSGAVGTAVGDSVGSSLCEATGGDVYVVKNGANVASGTKTPTALTNGTVYLLNWNWTTKNGGGWQIAQASVGGALSFAQMSSTGTTGGAGTAATGLVPRVCQYLRTVGAVASC